MVRAYTHPPPSESFGDTFGRVIPWPPSPPLSESEDIKWLTSWASYGSYECARAGAGVGVAGVEVIEVSCCEMAASSDA